MRTLSAPAQLDSDASSWSPEHMLLSAIGLGLMTTFEAFAARERIDVFSWQARVSGVVDSTDLGLQFTSYRLEITMEVSNVEIARATLEEAQQHSLIANALHAPVEVDARIQPRAMRRAC
ncbi:MAG: OsmC family protein [Deltaproteobacteria bacterium]|nr:OsmC family protein [Deltaproteobacteria bacterium]